MDILAKKDPLMFDDAQYSDTARSMTRHLDDPELHTIHREGNISINYPVHLNWSIPDPIITSRTADGIILFHDIKVRLVSNDLHSILLLEWFRPSDMVDVSVCQNEMSGMNANDIDVGDDPFGRGIRSRVNQHSFLFASLHQERLAVSTMGEIS